VLLSVVVATAASTAAAATGRGRGGETAQPPSASRACARDFGTAVRRYVRTTHRRDAAGFASLLDPRVVVVLRPGDVFYGKRATMRFIRGFFADPGWTQSFREITRTVRGCRTAFVLFDSVYRAPGADPLPLVIGVSFTRRGGRWLAVHNQDSQGPANPSAPPDTASANIASR
jgi:SnoaL-like domain